MNDMKILHMYHDVMNLYGEYANVLAMRDMIIKSGESCEVDRKTYGDAVNFEEYDFVYIGSGTERGQKSVLADFLHARDAFKAYAESGKVALLTGNSFEMLGKTITDCDGREYAGLGLFDFTVTEQNKTRNTADAVFTAGFLSRPLVGFINKCSEIKGVDKPMFSVRLGLGNCGGSKGEGVRLNNLFCTHLTGPVLMKNPEFLIYLTKLVTGKNVEANPLAVKGYEVTVRELNARIEQ